eukprot:CAMPEP_0205813734 /NCGR_PEP_ID=MMETSP0205-20121125/18473_1 /ASSEMBLY_ACC=CAM_ASM_000278 /TAXON_ID=36767 /ORGANISM="Euplotes focardii, Strain TN1" /LENGTH=164 /DNA_ID=CAMNT_0053096279 /DNA_START=124 /DNA_END=618 /DNA_ORIENTATION=+
MTLVSSAACTNDLLLDFGVMAVSEIEDKIKDKVFDIDSLSQYNMQNSNNQNRVLVHCAMGRSRSATMIIMYLMRKYQIEFEASFRIVKWRREIIEPNDGFIQKLKDFNGKQYRLKRNHTFFKGDKCEEIDELEEFSQYSESSSSSSEDLMDFKRRSSIDICDFF